MAEYASAEGAFCEAPARIENEFSKTRSGAIGTGDRNFGSPTLVWCTHQHQIAAAIDYAQTVLQPQIFTGNPNRVTVAVGTASTNAREVKIEQERRYSDGVAARFAIAGACIGYLFNNQQLMCASCATWRSDRDNAGLIKVLLAKGRS